MGKWKGRGWARVPQQSENCSYIYVCWPAEQKRDILPSPCGTDDNKHYVRHEVGIYPLPILRRQLASAYVTLMLQMLVQMSVPQEHDKHLKRRDCLLLIHRHTRWAGRCLSISME